MSRIVVLAMVVALPILTTLQAQEADTSTSKPSERVLGTVTAVDPTAHTVTVKDDKTGSGVTADLSTTKTLLRVEPGAKDLKNGVRITAVDLAVGDRVTIAGAKSEDKPDIIVARSVILMSARDLQQAHQAEANAWQHSTAGVVTAADPAAHTLTIAARTSEGTQTVSVDASNAAFTRYSPDNPNAPKGSALAEIQPGDQVRIIGVKNPDGSVLTAQKIYSSSFRTVVGTVASIAADNKSLTIKDLQTKQPVVVSLSDQSTVHKLPQMMAYMLARRFNPDFKMPQAGGQSGPGAASNGGASPSGDPAMGAKAGEAAGDRGSGSGGGQGGPGAGRGGPDGAGAGRGNWGGGPGAGGPGAGGPGGSGGGMRRAANGDLSQMIDQLPKISVSDLKSGDAVVISGSPSGNDKNHLVATNVIAGVEPIFQSASPRQMQSLGDWGASLSGSAGGDGGMPPQ